MVLVAAFLKMSLQCFYMVGQQEGHLLQFKKKFTWPNLTKTVEKLPLKKNRKWKLVVVIDLYIIQFGLKYFISFSSFFNNSFQSVVITL